MFRAFQRRIPFAINRITTDSFQSPSENRYFSTVNTKELFEKSCYHKLDFKINHTSPVQEAVVRFSAFDIGCLVVVDDDEKLVGIFSEGDFIKRVASVGRDSSKIAVKDVCTLAPNILVAKHSDTLEDCMAKMHIRNIRHLVIVEDEKIDGLISIKDLFRAQLEQNQDLICRLTNFSLGKGAFYGSE